jgi:hypothetical protein
MLRLLAQWQGLPCTCTGLYEVEGLQQLPPCLQADDCAVQGAL